MATEKKNSNSWVKYRKHPVGPPAKMLSEEQEADKECFNLQEDLAVSMREQTRLSNRVARLEDGLRSACRALSALCWDNPKLISKRVGNRTVNDLLAELIPLADPGNKKSQ